MLIKWTNKKTDTFIHISEACLNTTVFSPKSVCAPTISLIHPLCLSVCVYMSVCPAAYIYNPEVLSINVQQAFDVR